MNTDEKTARAHSRLCQRIVAIAKRMVPCKHLAIWAEARKEDDEVHPAEVWRILTSDPEFSYDHVSACFKLNSF